MIKFRVNGTPAPQGSKRHVGHGHMIEMSKAVGPWREAVRQEAQRAVEALEDPDHWRTDPLAVTVVFLLRRPGGHYRQGVSTRHLLRGSAPRFPAKTPDVDKLARAVLDGLVSGGVMGDDAQVVDLTACKRFADDGPPGAVVEVRAL